MLKKRETIILIVIIAALAVYLYTGKRGKLNYDLPALSNIPTAEVTSVELTTPGGAYAIAKTASGWAIAGKGYPADAAKVEEVIKKASELRLTALVSDTGNPEFYGLGPDDAHGVRVMAGSMALRDFKSGKPASTGRHTFVTLAGDMNIYQADGNLTSTFSREMDSMRDHTVFNIAEDITTLGIKSGGRETKFIRSAEAPSGDSPLEAQPKAPPTWTTSAGTKADSSAVNSLVKELSTLKCDSYDEALTPSEMSKPVHEITLLGDKTYTLKIYEANGDQHPATASGMHYVFMLSRHKAERLMKKPAELIQK